MLAKFKRQTLMEQKTLKYQETMPTTFRMRLKLSMNKLMLHSKDVKEEEEEDSVEKEVVNTKTVNSVKDIKVRKTTFREEIEEYSIMIPNLPKTT